MLDKYLHNNNFTTRKHLLLKFREVKGKGITLYSDMEYLINTYDESCFSEYDSKDCLDTIKEKLDIEYSDAEYLKLKKIRLTKEAIIYYSERFRYNQDVLISLRQEYNQQVERMTNALTKSI